MSSETALARVEAAPGGLVTREYLEGKAALVRQLYAPETSDLEFEHFIEVCVTRGLNPLAKQIYCVSRKDSKTGRKVATIQTGIDGFRLIAQRSGEYRGQQGPWWCGPDGVWHEVWLDTTTAPSAAKVLVLREGCEPFPGVVTWAAYADPRSSFWSTTKGVNQLAKCAESLALRRAFPEELSGLYTDEEMSSADARPRAKAAATRVIAPPATPDEPLPDLGALASFEDRFNGIFKWAGANGINLAKVWAEIGVSAQKDLEDDAIYAKARVAVGDDTPGMAEAVTNAEVIEGEVVSDAEKAAALGLDNDDPPEDPETAQTLLDEKPSEMIAKRRRAPGDA